MQFIAIEDFPSFPQSFLFSHPLPRSSISNRVFQHQRFIGIPASRIAPLWPTFSCQWNVCLVRSLPPLRHLPGRKNFQSRIEVEAEVVKRVACIYSAPSRLLYRAIIDVSVDRWAIGTTRFWDFGDTRLGNGRKELVHNVKYIPSTYPFRFISNADLLFVLFVLPRIMILVLNN